MELQSATVMSRRRWSDAGDSLSGGDSPSWSPPGATIAAIPNILHVPGEVVSRACVLVNLGSKHACACACVRVPLPQAKWSDICQRRRTDAERGTAEQSGWRQSRTDGVTENTVLEVTRCWRLHGAGGYTVLEVTRCWRLHGGGGYTVLEVTRCWRLQGGWSTLRSAGRE
jgi:hypothetical protein